MGRGDEAAVIGALGLLCRTGALRDLSDAQLLDRFATGRGEVAGPAFEAIVARHGAAVFRICAARLGDEHDALDAFQATFLVLMKKAPSLWVRDAIGLGPWLGQVARRASKAAASAAGRRRRLERKAARVEIVMEAVEPEGADLVRIVRAEVDRLPPRFRAAVVACDLEGDSHEQAAQRLGLPIGTVKSRLVRGRGRLRDRLTRRGLGPQAGWMIAGPALRIGSHALILRSSAAALALGVIRSMTITRWVQAASAVLLVGFSASGFETIGLQRGEATKPAAVADAADDPPAVKAKLAPGESTMFVGRGFVEPTAPRSVYNEVNGPVAIVSILPEGTVVKAGDVVCRLDESNTLAWIKQAEGTRRQAESWFQNARLTREVAEVAVQEYETTTFPKARGELDAALAIAHQAVSKAEIRLVRTKQALDKVGSQMYSGGRNPTPADVAAQLTIADKLDEAELAVPRERAATAVIETKLDRLVRVEHPKTLRELRAAAEKAAADELSRKASLANETTKESNFRKQLAACTLVAPGDGRVVYPTDQTFGRFGGGMPLDRPKEGLMVQARQMLFSVPDPSAPLRVKAKIPEPFVKNVKVGQTVQVKLDDQAQSILLGTVESINERADPNAFFNNEAPVHTARIKLDPRTIPAGLTIGAGAEVWMVVHDAPPPGR